MTKTVAVHLWSLPEGHKESGTLTDEQLQRIEEELQRLGIDVETDWELLNIEKEPDPQYEHLGTDDFFHVAEVSVRGKASDEYLERRINARLPKLWPEFRQVMEVLVVPYSTEEFEADVRR